MDDDEIKLRDKFAIAAIQALIGARGAYTNYIDSGAGMPDVFSEGRLDRITIIAYKIADAMRKTRLASFK